MIFPPNSKVCFVSPNGAISLKASSHRSAWLKMMIRQQQFCFPNDTVYWNLTPTIEDLNNADYIVLYLGMEFRGALNMFGGLSEAVITLLTTITNSKAELVFMELGPPEINGDPKVDVGRLITKRLKYEPEWVAELSDKCKEAMVWKQVVSTKIVVGDSHALWHYRPGWQIFRYDELTLHGFLKREHDLKNSTPFSDSIEYLGVTNLTYVFGNIDLRHHFLRDYGNPQLTLSDYLAFLAHKKQIFPHLSIEVAGLNPIENEKRTIPKSGWYKGTPFFGSWQEREEIRQMFNKTLKVGCEKLGIDYWEPPKWLYNSKGELCESKMEKPRSVHLSWECRREVHEQS